MESPRRRKILWWFIAAFFVLALLTHDLPERLFEATSPNRRFTVLITQNKGWGSALRITFLVEVRDNKSGEQLIAHTQPMYSGWHTYIPVGVKWSGNTVFKYFSDIPNLGTHTQSFKVTPTPFMVEPVEKE